MWTTADAFLMRLQCKYIVKTIWQRKRAWWKRNVLISEMSWHDIASIREFDIQIKLIYSSHLLFGWICMKVVLKQQLWLMILDHATFISFTNKESGSSVEELKPIKIGFHNKAYPKKKTSLELRMLSSVTPNCQETMIVMNPSSQLSERSTISHMFKSHVMSLSCICHGLKCHKGSGSLCKGVL